MLVAQRIICGINAALIMILNGSTMVSVYLRRTVLRCFDASATISSKSPGRGRTMKRKYSGFTLKEAIKLVSAEEFTPWRLNAPTHPPSATLQENLRRLESFDLQTTEQAKTLLIDDLFTNSLRRMASMRPRPTR